MDLYTLSYTLLTIAVLIAYINHRYIQMQSTIAIMVGSLMLSLILVIIGQFGFSHLENEITSIFSQINFYKLLIDGMLSFLLFAGALTVDVTQLRQQRWEIATLAIISTLASAFLVAGLLYYVLLLLGVKFKFIYCLLFGSLISPTDPIAVLGIFKDVKAPKKLFSIVAGESLFNDGVGIILFLSAYHVAFTNDHITTSGVGLMFIREALGGISYGAVLGALGCVMIKPLSDHKIEILITLAIVTGGYALAQALAISGPLAMVIAGIVIGSYGRDFSLSKKAKEALDNFWEMVDEILNAVLFLLVGFELLVISASFQQIILALLAIPLVLIVRFITVAIPMNFYKKKYKKSQHLISIVSWSGLRGGLAIALALALPSGNYRDLIIPMTYAVVLFSVIVQGLSIKPILQRILNKPE